MYPNELFSFLLYMFRLALQKIMYKIFKTNNPRVYSIIFTVNY